VAKIRIFKMLKQTVHIFITKLKRLNIIFIIGLIVNFAVKWRFLVKTYSQGTWVMLLAKIIESISRSCESKRSDTATAVTGLKSCNYCTCLTVDFAVSMKLGFFARKKARRDI
jgi:hypothetical protein